MQDVRRAFFLTLALAAGAPALGATLEGQGALALLPLAAAGIWLIAFWRRWSVSPGFALCAGSAAVVLWFVPTVGMGWLLVGMVSALAAWDLDAFITQLTVAPHVENRQALVRDHMRMLLGVCALALLVGAAALHIRMSLSFGSSLAAALLAVLGVNHVLRRVGRQVGEEDADVAPRP